MKKPIGILTLFFCGAFTTLVIAQGTDRSNQWDRSGAMAAIHSVDIDAAVFALSDISALADGQHTLQQLNRLENRMDWPLPAREAVIYRFTQSLANLPSDAVSPVVIEHLKKYQGQTLVPHEDHPTAFVPLFNIRAAAAGVENAWQVQAFAYEAQLLLESDPQKLVLNFEKTTSMNQRRAMLEVLGNAGLKDVFAVQSLAMERLGESPSLTQMVAATAVINRDFFAIEQLLTDGSGAGLSQALTAIRDKLPIADIGELLTFAINRAPARNATIAIAAWAPVVQHQADIRDLLVSSLSDPELGASAALALARQPDIQTIKILQDTANGESIAAKRAQMALDLNRDRLVGEQWP